MFLLARTYQIIENSIEKSSGIINSGEGLKLWFSRYANKSLISDALIMKNAKRKPN